VADKTTSPATVCPLNGDSSETVVAVAIVAVSRRRAAETTVTASDDNTKPSASADRSNPTVRTNLSITNSGMPDSRQGF
jgi:hypothetical protein